MKPKTINSQIYAEASDWLVEFRSGDIDTEGREDFYQWLKTSPEHMRAYLELAAIWNEGSAVDSSRTFDDARLVRDLESQTNVTGFPRARISEAGERSSAATESGECRTSTRQFSGPTWTRAVRTAMRNGRLVPFAAISLIAILGVTLWYADFRDAYATGIGEERTISLADGSTIELNSNSRMRLNFSRSVRGVELLRGQALFHVAKDHSRPFIVRSNSTQIRAVGTQFDVYQDHAATTVTVVEGTVAVLPAGLESSGAIGKTSDRLLPASNSDLGIRGGPNEMLLIAGEQVTVAPAMAPKPIKADVTAATSWTQHELTFKGATLESVAEQFNRYNQRRLIIHDPQIANLKVTGIFSSTDSASLIRFLEARPDIAVTQSANEIVVSRRP